MKGIQLTAKNNKGRSALRKHLTDKRKESFLNRKTYSNLYEERVLYDDDGVYEMKIYSKTRFIIPEAIANVAREMMTLNGAQEYDDYEITFIEDK